LNKFPHVAFQTGLYFPTEVWESSQQKREVIKSEATDFRAKLLRDLRLEKQNQENEDLAKAELLLS
jgi:hypothetical protein